MHFNFSRSVFIIHKKVKAFAINNGIEHSNTCESKNL